MGAWISASPRVQRLGAASVGLVLVAGLAGVVTHRSSSLPEPVTLAAAVGPVEALVASPPGAPGGARSSTAQVSRSKPASRVQAKAKAKANAKPAPKSQVRTPDWAYLAPRIRGCESYGRPDAPANYKAKNPDSSASGAYQIVDSTWAGRYGVQHASDATPEQQDAAAYELYLRRGTADWAPSAYCWR